MNQLWTTNIAYDIFVRDKRNTMTYNLLAKKVRYRSNPSSIVRLEQERIPIILSRRRPFLFHFRFPVACRFVRARFWPNDPLWAIKAPRRPLEDKRNETTRGPETKSSSTRLINYPVARGSWCDSPLRSQIPLVASSLDVIPRTPTDSSLHTTPFLIGNQVSPSLSIPNIVSRRINFSPL